MKLLVELLAFLGTIFTIFGVNLTQAFEKPIQSWIVFGLLCFLVIFFITRIYLVTRKMLKMKYPNGYLTVASFFKYSTLNGSHSIYEQFRHIQVKSAYKSVFEHRFVWTGTNAPKIESELQRVGSVKSKEDDSGRVYHTVSLTPKRSLLYNESDILHTKAIVENDDAEPFIAQYVREPIKFLNFKVELWYASMDYNEKAELVRKPIDKPNANEERLCFISFDHTTKSFSYTLVEPLAGFYYKIKWIKPKNNAHHI